MCLDDASGRRIRPFGDFAIVRRLEENAIITSALQLSVRYLYMDVVVDTEGGGRCVGSHPLKAS